MQYCEQCGKKALIRIHEVLMCGECSHRYAQLRYNVSHTDATTNARDSRKD